MCKAMKRAAAVLMALMLLFSDSAFLSVKAQGPGNSGPQVEAEADQPEGETAQNPEQGEREAAPGAEEGKHEDETEQQPGSESVTGQPADEDEAPVQQQPGAGDDEADI